jgi:hypothetical protein
MSNPVDPSGMGGAAFGSVTSQSEEAMQDTSVAYGGPGGHAPVPVGPAAAGPYPSYHGRTVSWVAVAIMVAGFVIGGLALIFGHGGPIWWLFWVGAGVAVLGLLVALATNMFEDWY